MAFDAGFETQNGWTARNAYWLDQSRKSLKPRGLRERRKEPLILSGHGVRLRVDKGTLHIRNGFTHYPQDQETFRFFRGDLNLPTRVIMLDGSGGISFDVLAWLSEQGVTLIQLDWQGEVVTVVGGGGYAGDAAKIAWQIESRNDVHKRMSFCVDLIAAKVAASITTLEAAIPPSKPRESALNKATAALELLKVNPPENLTALRLIEATCANMYFAAWRSVELKWKATGRFPIPNDWRSFASRASLANGEKYKNVRATHPLNAILNYAYGVSLTGLQIEAVAAGYDPKLGIMHHSIQGSKAYLFDLMEPQRPKVDAVVLGFALGETFSAADFVIRHDGVCRLSPQLACRITSLLAK